MAEASLSSPAKQRVYVIARDIQRNDAVGNFCVQIVKLLDGAGFDAKLAAENCHPDDRAHILKMPEALSTIEPDAVVLFQFSTYDPAFPAVAALPNPKIVFFQNITPERFFRGHDDHTADLVRQGLDQRPLCAQFDVIMANSVATAAALCEGLASEAIRAIDPSRIVACPPVIGTERWNDILPGDTKASDNSRLVLFVGRLVPHKGVDDLIDGFALLATDDPDVRLAIVGGPAHSPYALALKQRVAALNAGIGARIAFHHDITDAELKVLYRKAEVCASMSQHEGFGVPLLDAMFFDRPLVIRAEPGMEETAVGAAIVVSVPTAGEIAGALVSALDNPNVRTELAQARVVQLNKLRASADGRIIIDAIAEAPRRTKARQSGLADQGQSTRSAKLMGEISDDQVSRGDIDKNLVKLGFRNGGLRGAVLSNSAMEDPYICLISVLVPVYNTPAQILDETIQSVLTQTFQNWELCICDDCSTLPETREVLDRYQGTDWRIKIVRSPTNLNISRATNLCAEIACGEFLGFLDHDDVLEPTALEEVAAYLKLDPQIDLLYSDEDKLETDGSLTEPYFKPDWSPEHLTSVMYILHFTVVRKKLFFDLDMLRHEYSGAQDYDFALRASAYARKIAHIPKILYHWRKIPGSAAEVVDAKPDALVKARLALTDFAQKKDSDAEVVDGQLSGTFRVKWSAGLRPDPVTLLILTDARHRTVPGRGNILLVDHFIDSIRAKSSFPNIKIVVVDNGNLPKTLRDKFEAYGIKIFSYTCTGHFNFSHKANFSLGHVKTEDVILLNDDLEVITPDWIETLLSYSRQPEVGGVGGRLRFVDDRIQHAGMAFGLDGPAEHLFYNRPVGNPGYCGFSHLVRNFSAVTGAAFATTMSKLNEIGGFDEQLRIDYNDVDVCLRLRKQGYRIVYTPYAELYHFERSTAVRTAPDSSDVDLFCERWGDFLRADPYLNPNFVRRRDGDFHFLLSQ